ncbi:syntaxin-11-like [Solea senegalensis]|uniref:Syntaxin-11-like n=2 Tax=Solea senegalensis TaxID=28829 RepID=A0AAV6RXZ8_SOLSE|nr:syntaxin-11-like isoform X2 [Solea senegalensis]KAG7509834.1 syntaxin-11-like [Solea senegalensis]
MRDRLTHLHQVQIDSEGFSSVELDNLSENAAAAAAHSYQDIDGVLHEAQQIRLQIQQIQNDISDLKDVNHQALNKTTHGSATKRDSNAIGVDIKSRAEDVLHRLHKLNALREDLEAQRGLSDPTARIARTQYQCLSRALQEVMSCYNGTEMNHKEACKRQIQRQMEVVGREVTREELEELEEMMEREELQVFSDQMVGKTARSAALEIESRHRELLELHKRIDGIHELFLDVAMLVEEQGSTIDNIQKNVENSHETIQTGMFQLERATTSDKNNPFKKMLCGCFPCYYT